MPEDPSDADIMASLQLQTKALWWMKRSKHFIVGEKRKKLTIIQLFAAYCLQQKSL